MTLTTRTAVITIVAAALLRTYSPASNIADREISDMESAIRYCREAETEGPEGIWEFVEDETQVLIKKEKLGGNGYDIVVISTPDCRLKPGECIGHIERSAKKGKYRMKLYTSRDMGAFTDSRLCMAEYIEQEDAIIVHPMKLRVSVRTMWFLPRFWRSLRISFDNPAADLPKGLLKIYPRTMPLKPIYL